jgi:hypothetical protein
MVTDVRLNVLICRKKPDEPDSTTCYLTPRVSCPDLRFGILSFCLQNCFPDGQVKMSCRVHLIIKSRHTLCLHLVGCRVHLIIKSRHTLCLHLVGCRVRLIIKSRHTLCLHLVGCRVRLIIKSRHTLCLHLVGCRVRLIIKSRHTLCLHLVGCRVRLIIKSRKEREKSEREITPTSEANCLGRYWSTARETFGKTNSNSRKWTN